MNLPDLINDVSERLYWDDGETITPKVRKRILRGIERVFDRFSIDGRKLPTICQVEHVIESSDTRLTVGKGKDFNLWGSPQVIYYAAWRHDDKNRNKCNGRDGFNFGELCDEPLKVRYNDGDFHHNFTCKDEFFHGHRPTEMYFQRGEIVFSSKPRIGDKLIIRAKMPFDIRIGECMPSRREAEYEFDISPSHIFDEATRQSILVEACEKFDRTDGWTLCTRAQPCGDECADPVNVTVTASKVQENCGDVISIDDDLPDGYGSILYDILVHDLAGEAGVDLTPEMKLNRDSAIKLIHRSNDDPVPLERDYTTPWANRHHHDDDYLSDKGAVHSGRGICA